MLPAKFIVKNILSIFGLYSGEFGLPPVDIDTFSREPSLYSAYFYEFIIDNLQLIDKLMKLIQDPEQKPENPYKFKIPYRENIF